MEGLRPRRLLMRSFFSAGLSVVLRVRIGLPLLRLSRGEGYATGRLVTSREELLAKGESGGDVGPAVARDSKSSINDLSMLMLPSVLRDVERLRLGWGASSGLGAFSFDDDGRTDSSSLFFGCTSLAALGFESSTTSSFWIRSVSLAPVLGADGCNLCCANRKLLFWSSDTVPLISKLLDPPSRADSGGRFGQLLYLTGLLPLLETGRTGFFFFFFGFCCCCVG